MNISIINILLFCSVLGIGDSVLAQSQLLPCPETGYKHNCWGSSDFFGNKYEGDFKVGKPDGRGIFTDGSGNKFVGEFKNGKRVGRGLEYLSDGSLSRVGIWSDDKFIMADPGVSTEAEPLIAPTSNAGSGRANLKCSTQVSPIMPDKAHRDGVGGQVKAKARIKNGVVEDVTIISGPTVFHEAVREAMMQYKCISDAAEVIVTQEFNFKNDKPIRITDALVKIYK